jgi:radical SAM-linked protein
MEEIKKVRKTGLTIAPEAGSERLRSVINKGITEEALLRDANSAFGAGWRLIKLYFMIGLPTETMEDVVEIVELSRRVKYQGKLCGKGGEVNVSVSSFVPKAHTPFQWEEQISYEDILTKQEFLRNELKRRKLNFKWHDAPLSVIEGVFARGDRRLGRVLLEAIELGCRFDSWGDHFSFSAWQKAFAKAGIDPRFYLRRRGIDEILPWEHLDCGVNKEFLLAELGKSINREYTPDCREGLCSFCGVCDFEKIRNRLADGSKWKKVDLSQPQAPSDIPEASVRIRVRYSKTGEMIFLSHLEMITLFTRAVKRAEIPVKYSLGFHPHPKFSFATALSVGVESFAEYLDIEVSAGAGPECIKERLNAALPEGIEVTEAWVIPAKAPSLSSMTERIRYRVILPENFESDLEKSSAAFLSSDSHPFKRDKKGGVQEYDLRHELHSLHIEGKTLEMEIRRGKPLEFVSAITGIPIEELVDCRIEKLEVIFKDSSVSI